MRKSVTRKVNKGSCTNMGENNVKKEGKKGKARNHARIIWKERKKFVQDMKGKRITNGSIRGSRRKWEKKVERKEKSRMKWWNAKK